ncbi:MAG: uridine kinase [Deltaproteobacteria bacterium]|nr:uridine kinase [Deltaproteobacteria bacterium]
MPFVIGIAGGTGSGKTTIARRIAASVPAESVSTLEHDSYYRDRPDLTYEERCALNFDHPESLETPLLAQQLEALRAGDRVDAPIYDFKTHTRKDESRRVLPTPVIVVEGILVLAESSLRELFDIKIFVDTDADIRVFRRIRRDIEQRGRDFASIREQYYRTVRPMHLRFVEPSKRWADIIIPEGGDNRVALDLVLTKLRSVLRSSTSSLPPAP